MLKKMRRTMLRQVKLDVAEVLALRSLFPKLAKRLGEQHAELRDLPPDAGLAVGGAVRKESVTEAAQVTPVPEGFRQKVRTRWYPLWVNLIGVSPLVFLLGGLKEREAIDIQSALTP